MTVACVASLHLLHIFPGHLCFQRGFQSRSVAKFGDTAKFGEMGHEYHQIWAILVKYRVKNVMEKSFVNGFQRL